MMGRQLLERVATVFADLYLDAVHESARYLTVTLNPLRYHKFMRTYMLHNKKTTHPYSVKPKREFPSVHKAKTQETL